MQDKKIITYDDYCFFTDCERELATLQDNRLYLLKQKINRHIYDNFVLNAFFNTKVNKYINLINNKDFVQKCYKFRDYFYKCLPSNYAKRQETCTIPAYYFFYRKELVKLLYKNFSSDISPVTCITIGKKQRLLEKDKEIQNMVFKIKDEANGLYDFINKILSQFLYDDHNNKKAQMLFNREEKEILYECLDFYLMSIERKDPSKRYNESDCIVTQVFIKRVLNKIRDFIYNYLNESKETKTKHRLTYYESKKFKLNGKDFLVNSSTWTYYLYSICNGVQLADKPKTISSNISKINSLAEKIINEKLIYSQIDRKVKKTKYVLSEKVIFKDRYDDFIENSKK